VDNVAIGTTVEKMASFIESLGVRLLTCYTATTRRTRKEIREKIVPDDRMSFRVCIYAEDEKKLLHASDWPDSIVVAPWYFKPPDPLKQQSKGGAGAGDNMEATDAQEY